MKHGNENSTKANPEDSAQAAGGNPLPLRTDEVAYDLSDMGDAPLLAVLEGADGAPDTGDAGATDETAENSGALDEDKGSLTGKCPQEGVEMARRLITLATSLITGETAASELLPLLDAAKAREEIDRLRAEIEVARREGEIAGRNALIEERLVVPEKGVPDLNGSSPRNARPSSIFDLALDAR